MLKKSKKKHITFPKTSAWLPTETTQHFFKAGICKISPPKYNFVLLQQDNPQFS